MAASEELGILGVDNFHYFVAEPERSKQFYEGMFGWQPVAQAGQDMVTRTGQNCTVYEGGGIRVAVSTPDNDRCRAGRYLKRHPAGIGSMTFHVEDIEKAWNFLINRQATPITGIQDIRENGGRYRHFSITTAIGDVAFRFVEKTDFEGFAPGFDALAVDPSLPVNPLGFKAVDHVTNNAMSMASVTLWMEHVMGMEQCWEIEFHTEDVSQGGDTGTGLKSIVMWDPRSGLKFPVNEPLHPFFKEGQINGFVEENMGPGIQHIALEVEDAVATVRTLIDRGVKFLDTPDSYYDLSPARLKTQGVDVNAIAHDLKRDLQPQGILIDGSPENNYLIQVFLKDAATAYGDPNAGPFFYEIIQRCGDKGFGEGNFRALFESIEREQQGK